MRRLIPCVIVLVTSSVAIAQPGQTPPPAPQPTQQPAPQPYPQPYPPPYQQPYPQPYPAQPYVPPPYAYQPLMPEEQELLASGEISDLQHIGGGLASLFLGFGLGQAIQARWSDTGWIFTLGESASLAAIFIGASDALDDCADGGGCSDDQGEGLIVAGVIGFVVLHVWEIVDAFAAPPSHNRRVRELRMRLGYPPPNYYGTITPFVAPAHDGGGVAGVTLRF